MFVSKRHHIGKRAGLKNRGYFDIEEDYENIEHLIITNDESFAHHARNAKHNRQENASMELVHY